MAVVREVAQIFSWEIANVVVTDIYMYLLFYAVSRLHSLTILYYVLQRKYKEREIRKRSKSILPRWLTMIALFADSHV